MRLYFFLFTILIAVSGCASRTQVTPTKLSMSPIIYIVPSDANIIHHKGLVEDISFSSFSSYSSGKRELLQSKELDGKIIEIERRSETERGVAGSGIRYRINYKVEKNDQGYKATFQPVEFISYQQGLVLPFAVPNFGQQDLIENLLSGEIYYRIELDSEFNPESTYANFVRLVKTEPYRDGEKDPVTGKIFTQQFFLDFKGKVIPFTLETFPYRNGSKAVAHLRVSGVLTSENTVDFNIIMKDVKTKLESIVNA